MSGAVSRLRRRNDDFLLGQPVPLAHKQQVREFLLAHPDITVGPTATALFVNCLSPSMDLTSLVRGVESGMKAKSEHIYRADVVPVGGVNSVDP